MYLHMHSIVEFYLSVWQKDYRNVKKTATSLQQQSSMMLRIHIEQQEQHNPSRVPSRVPHEFLENNTKKTVQMVRILYNLSHFIV